MLTGRALLELWEAGSGQTPFARGLLLLGISLPEDERATMLDLTIGERNGRLLALRSRWFGDRAESTVACPQCGTQLEMGIDFGAFLGTVPVQASTGVRLRDLAEAVALGPGRGEELLASRAPAGWEESDPLALMKLAASCPDCGRTEEHIFDPVAFLWREVEARAVRLMQDVHRLALAYGWTEETVLALGPRRRQLYLRMTGAG